MTASSSRRCAVLVLVGSLALPVSSPVAAETPTAMRRAIDVQLDPVPLFLRGFAPELGVAWGRHRVFATAIAYDVPGVLAEDERFDERRDLLVGAGYQWFFTGHGRGPFAGGSLSLTHSTFTLSRTSGTAETETLKATLRIGWMVHPLAAVPALFVAPWLGPSLSIAPEELVIDGEQIHRKRIGLIGALQLGWRFAL